MKFVIKTFVRLTLIVLLNNKGAIQQKRREERIRLSNGVNVIERNKQQAFEHKPHKKIEHITHKRVSFSSLMAKPIAFGFL